MTVASKGGTSKPLSPPPPPSASNSVGTGAPAPATEASNIKTNVDVNAKVTGIGEGGHHADISIGGEMDSLLHNSIQDRLSGKNKMSDIVFQGAQEKLFKATQGQTRRGRMAAMADAARRGVFRSGATSAVIADIETEGIKAYSEGVKDLLIQKAQMDHEDMIKAIDQGQAWLANTRQYQLGLEQNAIAREQIKATLAAAAMSAAATRYAADRGLEGARANAGAIRAGQQQAYNDSRAIGLDGHVQTYTDQNGNTVPMSIQQFNQKNSYP